MGFDIAAYGLQLATVVITAFGLRRLRRRFSVELAAYWGEHPDVLLSWLRARHRELARLVTNARKLVRRVALILRLARPRTTAFAGVADSFAFTGSATASVTVGAPPRFDPSKDIGSQFDALGEYARVARQSVTDLDARIQELINARAQEHEVAVNAVTEKVEEIAFGEFGFAWLAVALLAASIAFEIAASMV